MGNISYTKIFTCLKKKRFSMYANKLAGTILLLNDVTAVQKYFL